MTKVRRHRGLPTLLSLVLLTACVADSHADGATDDGGGDTHADAGYVTDDDAYGDDDDVGVHQEGITGPGSTVSFAPQLVRIDYTTGGICSGFLVAPNMIVTAAHCVADFIIGGSSGVYKGMRWGYVQVRLVHKASASDVVCLNQPCRTASGSPRYIQFLAWWDNAYNSSSLSNDFAVLTPTSAGANFVAHGQAPGASPSHTLRSANYFRILGGSLPVPPGRRPGRVEYYGTINGYGAAGNGVGTSVPRQGAVLVDQWTSGTIWAKYRGAQATIGGDTPCKGDSGGPISFRGGVLGPDYVAGVHSYGFPARPQSCPNVGDTGVWMRVSPKLLMLDNILAWAGRPLCKMFSDPDLPAPGTYFRCW